MLKCLKLQKISHKKSYRWSHKKRPFLMGVPLRCLPPPPIFSGKSSFSLRTIKLPPPLNGTIIKTYFFVASPTNLNSVFSLTVIFTDAFLYFYVTVFVWDKYFLKVSCHSLADTLTRLRAWRCLDSWTSCAPPQAWHAPATASKIWNQQGYIMSFS